MTSITPIFFFLPGKLIRLRSNHFQIEPSSCKLFHYSVRFRNLDKSKDGARYTRKLDKVWYKSKFEILNQLVDSNCASPNGYFYDETYQSRIVHAFDGKENMYTYRRLRSDTFNQSLNYLFEQKELQLEIAIKFTAELSLEQFENYFRGDQSAKLGDLIRAVEIILKDGPVSNGLPTERGIFPRLVQDEEEIDPNSDRLIDTAGPGKKAVFGHIQTVKLMSKQLNLVVDRAAHAFYIAEQLDKSFTRILVNGLSLQKENPVNVAQTLFSFVANKAKRKEYTRLLNNELKSMQIETTHLSYRRKYRIFEITEQPIRELSFLEQTTKRTTGVCDYYREKYHKNDLCEALPAINVGKKNSPIYLPIEVCRIALNQKVRKLRSEETANLIKFSTHQKIENRFELIGEKVQLIKEQGKEKLRDLIHLDLRPIEVEGVQLFNPKLNYSNVVNYQPSFGKWKMQGKQVLEAGQLRAGELCLVNLTEKLVLDQIDQFVSKFREKSSELGLTIEQPFSLNRHQNKNSFFCEQRAELKKVMDDIVEVYRAQKPRLVIFFIGKNRGDKIYKHIKCESEINYGLHTQCVTEQLVHKILKYYTQQQTPMFGSETVSLKDNGDYILSSLILKVNSKLGGVNCAMAAEHNEISKLRDNLLVIGADVTHPSEENSFNYSICSVVSSLDANYFKYVSIVKIQEKSKEEIIKQMCSMMLELLELLVRSKIEERRRSGQKPVNENNPEEIYRLLPRHVLYYRDGISDGQYGHFQEFEIGNMHLAFEEFSKAKGFNEIYRPQVNTIIVMKRHTTRFQKLTDDNEDLNSYERQQSVLRTVGLSLASNDSDYQSMSEEQRYLIDEDSETGRTFNINPGTLVNNEKIVRTNSEFYLCSHNCDKGTIRSTHYCVLQNESKFELVELQKFTYSLCYLFAKGTKSISIPVPVKYAHQAAYRARNHLSLVEEEDGPGRCDFPGNQPNRPFYPPPTNLPPPVLPPPISPFHAGPIAGPSGFPPFVLGQIPFAPPPLFMPPQPHYFLNQMPFTQPPPPLPPVAPTVSNPPSRNQPKKKKGKKDDLSRTVIDEQLQKKIKVNEDLSLCFYFL